MAQALTHKRNARTELKPKGEIIIISDWDSYLYSHWLGKMASNPGLYDDAKLHHGWSCKCCSRTIFYVEEKKK